MSKSIRAILGATLLEVMLVLSVIALIILMSIKYYQSTSNAQQVQESLAAVQAITAAADTIGLGAPNGYTSVNNATVSSIAGHNNMASPWGGSISVSGVSATTYGVTIGGAPSTICNVVSVKLKSNPKYTSISCSAGIAYIYNATC